MSWFGKSFPTDNEDVTLLTLPCGTILEDACIWKNFAQTELGINPDSLWSSLQKYPTWDNNTEITFNPLGNNVHWINGKHPALNYRGRPVKRNKIWCQSNYENGMYKYGYTGWQHSISCAMNNVSYMPEMEEFTKKINNGLEIKHNQWIITEYESGDQNIGFHSDKDGNFVENSYFLVIKLGSPRKFEFRLKRTKEAPNPIPFYSEILEPGTAIFVGTKKPGGLDANSIVEHGVPVMPDEKKSSGSIVGRAIKTQIDWKTVQKNILSASKNKDARISKRAIAKQT